MLFSPGLPPYTFGGDKDAHPAIDTFSVGEARNASWCPSRSAAPRAATGGSSRSTSWTATTAQLRRRHRAAPGAGRFRHGTCRPGGGRRRAADPGPGLLHRHVDRLPVLPAAGPGREDGGGNRRRRPLPPCARWKIRARRWAGSAARSMPCLPISKRPSPPGWRPRPGCAASPRTPRTSCAPRW